MLTCISEMGFANAKSVFVACYLDATVIEHRNKWAGTI